MDKKDYFNTRVSFDIETTSIMVNGGKRAFPYSYAVCVDGDVTVLRTAEEFVEFLGDVRESCFYPEPDSDKLLVVYVHNLGFEYPFIRSLFQWVNVFCVGSKRRVVRAETVSGIEFRCSLVLTGKKLADVGKDVGIPKLDGDLDYSLPRHAETELTESELGYIYNDVLILDRLIEQKLEVDGGYNKIPLTSTGYVRKYFRKLVRQDVKSREFIKELVMTETDYLMSRLSYSGGYVHANATLAGRVVENVVSYDIASSYPNSMVAYRFPMSNFSDLDPENSLEHLGALAMLLTVTLKNIDSRYPFPPISSSKVSKSVNAILDNGRVFSADSVTVTVTDVELRTIMRAYDYDDLIVLRAKGAKYDYLPKPIVGGILKLYSDKTTLKNVSGREVDYKLAKAYINSVYGMSATDPVMSDFVSDSAGIVTEHVPNINESVIEHNDSRQRFLFYPWASWITSYARERLLNTIFDIFDAGGTVVYCDTDSIYCLDSPVIKEVVEKSNKENYVRIKASSKQLGYNTTLAMPKGTDGREYILGVWEEEHDEPIAEFKTLGAKRYAYKLTEDSDIKITVAGLPKESGGRWINDNGGMSVFKHDMRVPADKISKLSLTYFDDTFQTMVKDYQGNVFHVKQTGGVHMLNVGFNLSMGSEYLDFINNYC